MEFKDYYEILGIPRDADEKTIRAAYRRLARKYHPDVNPGDKDAEARFKEVNEANEVLSDPEKRKKYDELGARWKEYDAWQRAQPGAGATGQPFDWSGFGGGSRGGTRYQYYTTSPEDLRDLFGDERPFSDFFETLFGETRRRAQPRRGRDVEAEVEIDLPEVVTGATRLITLPSAAGGTRRLEAKIPPGVETGTRVRLAGQGEPGPQNAPSGDLYLVVRVRPHAQFERDGANLRSRAEAPFTTLVLGGELEVSTPTGRAALRIPAGTSDGQTFRLRGQGLPHENRPQQRGDLVVEVHARLPGQIDAERRRLFEELARLEEVDAGSGVRA